jgi:hypothetical protein
MRPVARELGVEVVVESSLERSGNHLTVRAHLIRANTDTHLWAERYDAEINELPQAVARIASDLSARLPHDSTSRPPHPRPLPYHPKLMNSTCEDSSSGISGRFNPRCAISSALQISNQDSQPPMVESQKAIGASNTRRLCPHPLLSRPPLPPREGRSNPTLPMLKRTLRSVFLAPIGIGIFSALSRR